MERTTGAPDTARFFFVRPAVVETVRASGVRRTFLRPSPGARSLYTRLGFVDDATGVMSLSA